jgi:magnesium transporter
MSNGEIVRADLPADADRRPPVGAAPGTLVSDANALPTRIVLTDYDRELLHELTVTQLSELKPFIDKPSVTWLDVTGFRDVEMLRGLGDMLKVHPLALADAIHVPQRAKAEAYPEYVFIVTHAPVNQGSEFATEQVALLFGEHFVLTFREREDSDPFLPLRERIRAARGLVRGKGPGYLGYAVVDVITDTYFPVLDDLENRLNELEQRILDQKLDDLSELYMLRREALSVRRAIESHRDALSTLMHIQAPYINDELRLYLRDCLDHALSQSAKANSLLEYVVSLRELLSTQQTQRLNEIMKVLTLVATIFIPLGFFAGIYGMNFDPELPGNMPELNTPYAYWIWWGTMIVLVTGMLWYFKRRRWIGK